MLLWGVVIVGAVYLWLKNQPAQPAHATQAAGGGRVVANADAFNAYIPGFGSVRIGAGGWGVVVNPTLGATTTNPAIPPSSGVPVAGTPTDLAADAPTPALPTDAVPPDAPDPSLDVALTDPSFMALDPAPIVPDVAEFDPSLSAFTTGGVDAIF